MEKPEREDGKIIALHEELIELEQKYKEVGLIIGQSGGDREAISLRDDIMKAIENVTKQLAEKNGEDSKERKEFQEGEYCTAKYSKNGRWYTARVVGKLGGKYEIVFVGYKEKHVVKAEHMQDYHEPDAELIQPGSACEAMHPIELKWQKATVETSTRNNTFWVTFGQERQSEEVSKYHVRPSKELIALLKKRKMEEREAAAMKKKRKKKQAEVDEAGMERQESWKSFMNKSKRRKTRTPGSRASIFVSPDTLDGRVGVTGSDKRFKMTEYVDSARTRHNW